MAEPKAQLVAPVGNISLPGINATGVITASSLSGDGGVVTNLTGSPNLNVGVVTASSFVGECSGHAAGLTGTPNVNLGLTTSTGFVGDATGKAANLTGSPNIEVGLITATSFVGGVTGNVTGNITGLAGSITQGKNIHVGVMTATSFYGDGSNLTGIAATNFNPQNVTISTGTTTLDLSAGNVITLNQEVDTTISLANTSTAQDITLIRKIQGYDISYSTGGVTLDGNDYLTMTGPGDLGTGTDFTQECWAYVEGTTGTQRIFSANQSVNATEDTQFRIYEGTWEGYAGQGAGNRFQFSIKGVTTGWHHLALCRGGGTFYFFVDGVLKKSETASHNVTITNQVLGWGKNVEYFTGIISNARFVNGTCLYDSEFVPPKAELTNVTNTSLLCCQSTSSATAATVGPPSGSITANGDPTAGSHTVALSGSLDTTITWPNNIKWTGGSAPELVNGYTTTNQQVFKLLTRDTGVTWYGWEAMTKEITAKTLWGWGRGDYGQLGQNNTTNYSSPVQIPGKTWTYIGMGGDALMGYGVKSDGTGWAWGRNNRGQLGINNTVAAYSSPVQLGTDTTWQKYNWGTGDKMCAAIKTDGTLWYWGNNSYGSGGTNVGAPDCASSPVQIGTDTTWSYIGKTGAGSTGWGAIKTDGTLWTWGRNEYGAGGLNDRTRRSSPTQVGTDTSWALIDTWDNAEYSWSIATKTDGTLWTWGYGDGNKGVLGLTIEAGRSSPCQVGTETTYTTANRWQINNGGMSSGAIKTDGTLWMWGSNAGGQLGFNSVTAYSSPKQLGTATNWGAVFGGGQPTSAHTTIILTQDASAS